MQEDNKLYPVDLNEDILYKNLVKVLNEHNFNLGFILVNEQTANIEKDEKGYYSLFKMYIDQISILDSIKIMFNVLKKDLPSLHEFLVFIKEEMENKGENHEVKEEETNVISFENFVSKVKN